MVHQVTSETHNAALFISENGAAIARQRLAIQQPHYTSKAFPFIKGRERGFMVSVEFNGQHVGFLADYENG